MNTNFEQTIHILDKCIDKKRKRVELKSPESREMHELLEKKMLKRDFLDQKKKGNAPPDKLCCGVKLKVKNFIDAIHSSPFIGKPHYNKYLRKQLEGVDPKSIKVVDGKNESKICQHREASMPEWYQIDKKKLLQRKKYHDDLLLMHDFFSKGIDNRKDF